MLTKRVSDSDVRVSCEPKDPKIFPEIRPEPGTRQIEGSQIVSDMCMNTPASVADPYPGSGINIPESQH
jgi:hypothetical protein